MNEDPDLNSLHAVLDWHDRVLRAAGGIVAGLMLAYVVAALTVLQ